MNVRGLYFDFYGRSRELTNRIVEFGVHIVDCHGTQGHIRIFYFPGIVLMSTVQPVVQLRELLLLSWNACKSSPTDQPASDQRGPDEWLSGSNKGCYQARSFTLFLFSLGSAGPDQSSGSTMLGLILYVYRRAKGKGKGK